jgi:hypothetical protein
VEIFPDELPEDAGELMDVLISEYAPLRIWKSVAVRVNVDVYAYIELIQLMD